MAARTRVTMGITTRKMIGNAIAAATSPYQTMRVAITANILAIVVIEILLCSRKPPAS